MVNEPTVNPPKIPDSFWDEIAKYELPKAMHFPLSGLSEEEHRALMKTLNSTHPDASQEERKRVTDAYLSLRPDDASVQALQELDKAMHVRIGIAIDREQVLHSAIAKWDAASKDEKIAALRVVENTMRDVYIEHGFGHREGMFPTYQPMHYVENANGRGGSNFHGMVDTNLYDATFLNAVGTVYHEYQHSFQRWLGSHVDALPDARLRSAAEIFHVNTMLGREGTRGNNSESFAYMVEPIEMDARRVQHGLIDHLRGCAEARASTAALPMAEARNAAAPRGLRGIKREEVAAYAVKRYLVAQLGDEHVFNVARVKGGYRIEVPYFYSRTQLGRAGIDPSKVEREAGAPGENHFLTVPDDALPATLARDANQFIGTDSAGSSTPSARR